MVSFILLYMNFHSSFVTLYCDVHLCDQLILCLHEHFGSTSLPFVIILCEYVSICSVSVLKEQRLHLVAKLERGVVLLVTQQNFALSSVKEYGFL